MPYRSWQALVADPGAERHIVQLYRDEAFVRDGVARWIAPALASGGGGILIGTPERLALIMEKLRDMGADPDSAARSGRLVTLDAHGLLASFMVKGTPEPKAFDRLVSGVVREVRGACLGSAPEIRAWGEMVNVLRERGEGEAAQRLESMWNDLIDAQGHGLRLLCSYHMDNLDPATHAGPLQQVCAGHSVLLPEADYDRFDNAFNMALVDVFGEQEAGIVRSLFAKQRAIRADMPAAEAALIALQEMQPEVGKRVLSHTRLHLLAGGA